MNLLFKKLVEEFSHTVLHGENFAHRIQSLEQLKGRAKPSPSPTPRPVNPVAPAPLRHLSGSNAAAAPNNPPKIIYDPSKIYNAPVAPRRDPAQLKKSIEKRNAAFFELKKKQAPLVRLPSAESENNADRKTPLSFLEQQKKKAQEEIAQLKKRQKEIAERQKVYLRHK